MSTNFVAPIVPKGDVSVLRETAEDHLHRAECLIQSAKMWQQRWMKLYDTTHHGRVFAPICQRAARQHLDEAARYILRADALMPDVFVPRTAWVIGA